MPSMGKATSQLVLVLGGARSGKSTFAQQLAQSLGGDEVVFLATWRETAQTLADPEAQHRIARHRATRPAAWRTLVVDEHFAERWQAALAERAPRAVLLDCLSLYISGALFMDTTPPTHPEEAAEAACAVLFAARQACDAHWVVVSNEVGMGLVPSHPAGRAFRDALGRANQWWASRADAAWLVVAGLPMRLK